MTCLSVRRISALTAFVIATCSLTVSANNIASLQAALGLSDCDVVTFDAPVGLPDDTTVQVEIAGSLRTLSLTKRSLRSVDFEYIENDAAGVEHRPAAPAVRTYRGLADGDESNIAAISLMEDGIEGMVRLADGELYFIQPAARYAAGFAPNQYVVYRRSDLIDPHTCPVGDDRPTNLIGSPRGGGAGQCELGNARIALVADAAFTAFHGGSTMAAAESIMNAVTAIYESELNITYTIAQFISNAANPYALVPTGGGEVSYSAMLNSFDSWYRGVHGSVNRNFAHLLSRENFQSTVIGWASVGSVCSSNGGSGVDQMTFALATNAATLSHEIGHNWGATHCSGGDCDIMAASVCTNCPIQPSTFGTQASSQILGGFDQGCVDRPDDCNFNGVCDDIDIMMGVLTDNDNNGTPDDCELVTNLNTGATYGNIQSGISGALNGHTLQVKAGTYNENIEFFGRSITLVSESGPGATIIDATGQNTTTVVVFDGETVTVDGFFITGGSDHPQFSPGVGGGLLVFDGSLTLQNSIVGGNTTSPGNFGGGMFINGGEFALISNTVFCENFPQNIAGPYTDGGGNTFPAFCPDPQPTCPNAAGDVNGDSAIDGADVQFFVSCFLSGSVVGGDCTCADINGDNATTNVDIAAFVALLVL